MGRPLEIAAFFLATLVLTVGWGRMLWYFDERSKLIPRLVLFALGYTRRTAGEVRALLLSFLYYSTGLALSLGYILFARLDLAALFGAGFDLLPLVLLGSIAEISISGLLVNLYCALTRTGPERFAEVRSIPWMAGLRALPEELVPWGAAVGAAIEELFFRGVLITVLVLRLDFEPALAVLTAGALFCFQQLLQVRTRFQAAVIGAGSFGIALVGGLLVVHTGSVLGAILCHCASVVFYLRRGEAQPGPQPSRAARA